MPVTGESSWIAKIPMVTQQCARNCMREAPYIVGHLRIRRRSSYEVHSRAKI